jgi:hypothetical protein
VLAHRPYVPSPTVPERSRVNATDAFAGGAAVRSGSTRSGSTRTGTTRADRAAGPTRGRGSGGEPPATT